MSLQSYDKEIFDLVNLELERQCDHLEMIANGSDGLGSNQ